jgi:two-component sensor histidine kinase
LGGVALALSEAVGNVIQHAYLNAAGDIDVSMLSSDQEIVIMGAATVISGISEQSAIAIARLGIDLGDITTAATLQDAVNELRTSHFDEPAAHAADVTDASAI